MANIIIFVGNNVIENQFRMKHLLTVLGIMACVCAPCFALTPDPASLSRKALGFEGNVSKAVLREYSCPDLSVLKGVTTYVFNEAGEILTCRYENASGSYFRLYFFQRDSEGKLTDLTVTENGRMDSFVVYTKGIETCYSSGHYLVSITVNHCGERYLYDATEKDNYREHPERYFSRTERKYDDCGRVVCELTYTLGEESERREFTYDERGLLLSTATYLDRELDTVVEFSPDRRATLSVDASGQILSFTTISLEYFE